MPNGGLSVSNYVLKMLDLPDKYSAFVKLNNALIQLLVNGIVPINKLGFNHFDVKYDNILLGKDNKARLIDWSLASENDRKTIPSSIRDRSIHFNMPVSLLFFNSFVKDSLRKSYKQIKASPLFANKNSGQNELLKIVALNMINEAMLPPKNDSHYRIIVDNILRNIYKLYVLGNSESNLINYRVLTNNVVVEYIHAVLVKYVDENGNFDDIRYFYEVFSKNADIWGFILSYSNIIEYGADKIHKDIINGLCRIFLKYCFSPEFAATPIDINLLIADLTSLNKISTNVSSPVVSRVKKTFNTITMSSESHDINNNNKSLKLNNNKSLRLNDITQQYYDI